MSDHFGNETPQGGTTPPPSSPPNGGFTVPGDTSGGVPGAVPPGAVPPGAVPPSGVPSGAVPPTFSPAGAVPPGSQVPPVAQQWQPQEYGAGDPGNQLAVGVGPRIGARLIDSIALFALLFFPLALVFGIIGAMLAGSQDPAALQSATQQQQVSAVASLAGLIVSVPAYLINEVVLVKLKGWNIGKVALGQRVVDAQTGAFLSWGQAFKRFLFYYGPGLLANIIGAFVGPTVSAIFTVVVFVYYIALAVSIARGGPLFQGWHDKFAGSKVIKKPAF